MDKTIRILLAAGIAILFPVLVYFACLTVYPKKHINLPVPPDYPQVPSCINYESDLGTSDYYCTKQQQIYDQQTRTYEHRLDQYNQDIKDYDKQNLKQHSDRAVLALVISIITIGLCVFIRNTKELASGLVIGAVFSIVVAISVIIAYLGYSVGSKLPVVMIALSFVVLSVVLYFLDKYLPNGTQAIVAMPPQSPHHFSAEPPHHYPNEPRQEAPHAGSMHEHHQ